MTRIETVTQPASLAPDEPDRPTESGRVDQADADPAVNVSDHPAPRATLRFRSGLERYDQLVTLLAFDSGDMQAGHPNKQIATLAIGAGGTAAQRRLGHRRGP
ncbi:hypothetical protein GCM10009811_31520 [Nostocoides veronense]|uniref:Uncharacterized protein n=1 Tax=Nostocoides veronense TaxID=330836 RepID=A0ABP4YCW3_9MICO